MKKKALYCLSALVTGLVVSEQCIASDSNHNALNTYIALKKEYETERNQDPTNERLQRLSTTTTHLMEHASISEQKIWKNRKIKIESLIKFYNQLEASPFLEDKLVILEKMAKTYKKESNGRHYFSVQQAPLLQQLIQPKIDGQSTPAQEIRNQMAKLAQLPLTNEQKEWLEKERQAINTYLKIEVRLRDLRNEKNSLQDVRKYYQTRQRLYQEQLDTYSNPNSGTIPTQLQNKIARMSEKIDDQNMAITFGEMMQKKPPLGHDMLAPFANTLARKFPKKEHYAQLAARYTALSELDAIRVQYEMTNLLNARANQQLINRITQLNILFAALKQDDSHKKLLNFEKKVIKKQDNIYSWLKTLNKTDMWEINPEDELYTQKPSPIEYHPTTCTALKETYRDVNNVTTDINSFKEKLGKLSPIHPFSQDDHKEYTTLVRDMANFTRQYHLPQPTLYTTQALIIYLLEEQKNDLVMQTLIRQIRERKKEPAQEICKRPSALCDSMFLE